MKVARDRGRARGIERPAIVIPVTGHAAFHKAAHYLGVDLTVTPVDRDSFQADVGAMASAITDSTVMLVGSATSYAHGVIDPIAELGALAQERDLLLHVDGCIGGFLLPYLKRLGEPIPAFDFSVPGVTSISMDLHKYAYCPKGASVVLYRSRELRKHQLFACARWTGYTLVNATVQSSKSGGPLAAAWAVLHHMGDEGYLAIARSLLDARNELVAGIAAIEGLRVLGRPAMSLLSFTSDNLDFFALADAMRRRGWYVQPQLGIDGHPANLHPSINPNNVPLVDEFLIDLAAAAAAAPPRDASGIGAAVRQTFAGMSPAAVDDNVIRQMLAMTGVGSFDIPEETALVNTALDAIPPALKERLVIAFVNELFRQP
jgi:glutamate/tyrosine decarboxylase-like PLP-dependent enzyme